MRSLEGPCSSPSLESRGSEDGDSGLLPSPASFSLFMCSSSVWGIWFLLSLLSDSFPSHFLEVFGLWILLHQVHQAPNAKENRAGLLLYHGQQPALEAPLEAKPSIRSLLFRLILPLIFYLFIFFLIIFFTFPLCHFLFWNGGLFEMFTVKWEWTWGVVKRLPLITLGFWIIWYSQCVVFIFKIWRIWN